MALEEYLGRSAESLHRRDRERLRGMWIALELYSPKTLPMRLIEAVGRTPGECVAMLRSRGLDPRRFEMTLFPRS
jgi:hypothetical protein